MELLQVGKAYHPHIGGIETVMCHVAEGAASASWASRVLVAGDSRRRSHEVIRGVDVVRTASFGRVLSLPIAPGFGRALRRERADALIVHEPTLLAAFAMIGHRDEIRRRFGRIVVWWHSDIVRQRFAAPAYTPLYRHLLGLADVVVAATPKHVTSSETLRTHDGPIAIVPYGIDVDRYAWTPDRAQRVQSLRAALGPGPLVVYAGRLARYKGIPALLAAFEHVPDGRLVVAGTGPALDELTASPAHRAGRITILPHLDDVAFVDLLWAADVFALPSTQNSEAFGIVQVEAMACRTPVVSFDLPTGVTWVNRHGETGLVAPLGDATAFGAALTRLLDDDTLREEMAAAAQDRALTTFRRDDMVARALEICAHRGASWPHSAALSGR